MGDNKNTLPLEMEIETLRQKLKTSNHESVEECERLRSEIQKLYFQMARTTRPGRYAGKRSKIKDRQQENQSVTPEVIPPDLDINEYLSSPKDAAAARKEKSKNELFKPPPREKSEIQNEISGRSNALVPATTENSGQLSPDDVSSQLKPVPQNLHERDATIEERFTMVAKRMEERRQRWLESEDKKRPWWKKLVSKTE